MKHEKGKRQREQCQAHVRALFLRERRIGGSSSFSSYYYYYYIHVGCYRCISLSSPVAYDAAAAESAAMCARFSHIVDKRPMCYYGHGRKEWTTARALPRHHPYARRSLCTDQALAIIVVATTTTIIIIMLLIVITWYHKLRLNRSQI